MEVVLVVQHPLCTHQCVSGDPRGLRDSGDLRGQSGQSGDTGVGQVCIVSTLSYFFTSFLFSSSFSSTSFSYFCTSVPATMFRLFRMLCVNTIVKRILDLSQFFREFPVEC